MWKVVSCAAAFRSSSEKKWIPKLRIHEATEAQHWRSEQDPPLGRSAIWIRQRNCSEEIAPCENVLHQHQSTAVRYRQPEIARPAFPPLFAPKTVASWIRIVTPQQRIGKSTLHPIIRLSRGPARSPASGNRPTESHASKAVGESNKSWDGGATTLGRKRGPPTQGGCRLRGTNRTAPSRNWGTKRRARGEASSGRRRLRNR